MKKFVIVLIIISIFTAAYLAQRKSPAIPARSTGSKPASAAKPVSEKGIVNGRTYTDKSLGFSITFPETWSIAGDDFEAEMKKKGYDLSLKAPAQLTPGSKAKLDRALTHVSVLVTAYRSEAGFANNAIMRVSVEDLSSQPQIKDAVDYFDAVRQSYKTMLLPPDFKYSDTQAEKLGKKAFAFLDTSNKAGKKRLYATVRNGKAILFTLSYVSDEDLKAMRDVLSSGDFSLNDPS